MRGRAISRAEPARLLFLAHILNWAAALSFRRPVWFGDSCVRILHPLCLACDVSSWRILGGGQQVTFGRRKAMLTEANGGDRKGEARGEGETVATGIYQHHIPRCPSSRRTQSMADRARHNRVKRMIGICLRTEMHAGDRESPSRVKNCHASRIAEERQGCRL